MSIDVNCGCSELCIAQNKGVYLYLHACMVLIAFKYLY